MESIRVKTITRRNPLEPDAELKHYAVAVHNGKIDLDELASEVADRCSMRRADVYGVLVALTDFIPQALKKGKVIGLGKLGTFSVTISSGGETTATEVTPTTLKGFKLLFRPTKELREQLQLSRISFSNQAL